MYLHIAVKSFQKNLVHRAANLAGIVTNVFFGAVYVFIYSALLQDRGQVSGLDVSDAVTYAVLSQSLLMVMSAFGNRELSDDIVKGQIATDLSRPVDFYLYWAAIDLGRAVYYLIFRGVPTYLIGMVVFRARLPANLHTWVLFFICVAVGIAVSFAFRFITSSLAFWTTDARGIIYLTSTLILFFAGFIVPLYFFPPWLRAVAELLPFRGMAQLPIGVYLSKLQGTDLARAMALQAVWLVVLVLMGRLVLNQVVGRLTVGGG